MSTFDGLLKEFPRVQIDNFRLYGDHQPPLACFLSHVHSDHLTGLESFKSPFVYCTAPTRELLLKLEKYPHRMNFAKGILETRKQTYRKLKRLLKPIPLGTPTVIELTHGYSIQVTLFDANHCTGACMFLIEGDGKAILYTGDIRSEPWWVDSLTRNPIMIPFATGQKRLDTIYLDTTFAMGEGLKMDFPSKAEGLRELLVSVAKYPDNTVFYIDAWTFGYEEVWIALAKALNTRVHLCDYRYRVYNSMKAVPECFGSHSASLLGFQLGNSHHDGCLTNANENVRLHSCEKGAHCGVLNNPNLVRITPIITRYHGVDVAEVGAGGGQNDLDQTHELELNDIMAVTQLIAMCDDQLKGQPGLRTEVVAWLQWLVQSGQSAVKLDFEGFWTEIHGTNDIEHNDEKAYKDYILDDVPLADLVPALAKLVVGVTRADEPETAHPKRITFPFSRHSSFNELRCLVEAFRPKEVFPCTVDDDNWTPEVSMEALFGDLCSGGTFQHDQLMMARHHDRLAKKSSTVWHGEGTQSEPQTPEQKRKMPPEHRDLQESGRSPDTPVSKKSRSIIPHAQAAMEGMDLPSLRSGHSPDTAQPHSTAARHSVVGQPVRQTTTPASTVSMVSSDSRDRVARRAAIDKSIREGVPWQGLRSVRGYHNDEPEQEL